MMDKTTHTRNFAVRDLGIQEMDVYDIEVDDLHNFFANNILVHNSVYVDISPFTKGKAASRYASFDRDKKIDFLDYVCKEIEKNAIQTCFEALGRNLNLYSHDNLKMKRENIAAGLNETGKCGFWTAKKHYMLDVDDSEGLRYSEPHPKSMGMPYVQTIYAEYFRKAMKKCVEIFVRQGIGPTREYIENIRKEIRTRDLNELSLIRGASDIKKYTDINGEPKKGAGVHLRAAIYFNKLVKEKGLENKYELLKDGAKLRFVYLKDNPYHRDVMGFIDKLPKEFELDEYIDYETIFEKSFLKPITDIINACGQSVEEKFETGSLFGD